jgi:hypothetical protein
MAPSYANYTGTIFVDGPRCEGKSGRSHLESPPLARKAGQWRAASGVPFPKGFPAAVEAERGSKVEPSSDATCTDHFRLPDTGH